MFSNKFLLSIFLTIFFFLAGTPAVYAEITELKTIEGRENIQGIELFWIKPSLQETEGVVVIRKQSECPVSISDGKEIYRGNGSYAEDPAVKTGESYCYGAFVYDSSGNASALRRTQVIEKKGCIKYILSQIGENNSLASGIVIVIILSWINKVTMKKKKEVNKVIMKV